MKLTTRTAACIVATAALACAGIGVPAIASAATGAHQASRQAASTPAGAVPKGFIADSTTWVSPTRGWVLGATQCGKESNCPDSDVLGTTDGGTTWSLIGKIKAQIPKLSLPGTGITEIRFATAKVGWAFAPGLFRTANGGRTWASMPIPGHGKQILDLAVSSTGAAYAIVSPCAFETGLCSSKPLTAWRTNLAGKSWIRMPLKLHKNVTASVAAYGKSVYVVNPRIDGPHASQLYASTDGGRHFSARYVPCTVSEEYNLVQAVPTSAKKVAFLCDGNPGFGKAVKAVYVSTDTGKKDSYAGTMGVFGIQAQLTVSPSGNLAVESWSIGSFIYINDNHKTTWHMIIGSGDGGAGFNDITYVSNKVAWVIYGPADMFSGYGQVYRTRDAGRHWQLVTL